jgi:hypothetical protein
VWYSLKFDPQNNAVFAFAELMHHPYLRNSREGFQIVSANLSAYLKSYMKTYMQERRKNPVLYKQELNAKNIETGSKFQKKRKSEAS